MHVTIKHMLISLQTTEPLVDSLLFRHFQEPTDTQKSSLLQPDLNSHQTLWLKSYRELKSCFLEILELPPVELRAQCLE